jgi:glycosyltransferase involved in cell wall biosynthesis
VKVLFLLTQDRGGPVDLTAGLASELTHRPGGPQITIAGPGLVCSAADARHLLRPLEITSKADLRGMAAASRLLAELAPDVIHAQDRRAGLVACLLAGRRMPVVMTFHGVPDLAAGQWVTSGPLYGQRPGLSGGSRLLADGLIARRVSRTVAPSSAIADFLHRRLRVPRQRICVLPNGVRIPAGTGHARRPGVTTFATVSSFAPCKATPLLVSVFLAMAARRPGLRLLMIGDGEDRALCQELVRQAGLGDQVEFTGYRTDATAQLERADAFVLPSLNENLPLALLEAMASGLPCIASAVGGIPEALTADCGILVPPGNPQALRAAMEQLAAGAGAAAALGAAARRRVAGHFSVTACAEAHLALWHAVLARARR